MIKHLIKVIVTIFSIFLIIFLIGWWKETTLEPKTTTVTPVTPTPPATPKPAQAHATRIETVTGEEVTAATQPQVNENKCTDAKANNGGCFLELPSSGQWTDKYCLTQGHMPGDYILDTHEVSGCVKMALYRSRSDESPVMTEDCAGQASMNDKTLGSYPMCVAFARSTGDQVQVQFSSAHTIARIFR